jgi:hypothetical protein
MVAMTSYSGAIIKVNMEDEFQWGTQIYIKQTCDIDLNGKEIFPMCYYWLHDNATDVKGPTNDGAEDEQQ